MIDREVYQTVHQGHQRLGSLLRRTDLIENVRLKGFVIGSDRVGDDAVWEVRVNDETNGLHRQKFEVASVHGDISLAKGLEVEFLLGNFLKDGHPVQKAVDVTIL
jgi:hypothetical protein